MDKKRDTYSIVSREFNKQVQIRWDAWRKTFY